MRIRKFNESTTWTTYNSLEAKNLLEEVFSDYTQPIDNSVPAVIEITKIGHALLAMWSLKIPFNFRGNLNTVHNKIDIILKDLKHKVKFLDNEFEDLRHEIEIKDNYLILHLWNKDR